MAKVEGANASNLQPVTYNQQSIAAIGFQQLCHILRLGLTDVYELDNNVDERPIRLGC